MNELKQQRPELDQVSHQLGELIHIWGFKRIHGRIWSRLFLSNRPLDAADLIEQLDISKALVSISLRELLDVKAVEEVGRSARGTNLFCANRDLKTVYLETLKKRELHRLQETKAALAALGNLDAAVLNSNEISSSQITALDEHLTAALGFLHATLSEDLSNSSASSVTNSSMNSSNAGSSDQSAAHSA